MSDTNKPSTRRKFISTIGCLTMATSFINLNAVAYNLSPANNNSKRKIYLFSKHLHWLSYGEMAEFISDLGFDGVDLTVRDGGHVEPGKVAEQLPKVVEALKKVGKEIKSIATGIRDVGEENSEQLLKTASQLGIESYRMGWYSYLETQSISDNLKDFEKKLRALTLLNEKYKIKGTYQNHAGTGFGASIWDLAQVLQKINSPFLGCQFDIRHATVEGANSWKTDFKYIQPFIHSLDIKDFRWVMENGKAITKNVPLGEGIVDFEAYFKLIGNLPADVPLILHLEYPLGGAEEGHKQISISQEDIKTAMKRDLEFIKGRLNS